jgi:cyanophycinase
MTQAGPLSWLSGEGWIVLIGGEEAAQEESGDIDVSLLAHTDFTHPIAYVPTASGSPSKGEALLEDYADLGGPRGDIVPLYSPADAGEPSNRLLLAEAGLIYIGDGKATPLVQTLSGSLALQGMVESFLRGGLIVGVGAGAMALGSWIVGQEEGGSLEPGLGWLQDAVVVPQFVGAAEMPSLQAALRQETGVVGLGIPQGTALALGPAGQVETWGAGEVTVVVAR